MGGRREQTRAKLKKRCEALAGMIIGIRPVYENHRTSEDQRRFVETVIGAAVWYLPEVEECWTGMMSLAALRSHHPDSAGEPRLTKDHEYPRKLAAAELMAYIEGDSNEWADKLFELYVTKYGRYNYVTPQENKALMRYQKKGVFEDPATSYEDAGIRLLALTGSALRKVRARRRDTIEAFLNIDVQS